MIDAKTDVITMQQLILNQSRSGTYSSESQLSQRMLNWQILAINKLVLITNDHNYTSASLALCFAAQFIKTLVPCIETVVTKNFANIRLVFSIFFEKHIVVYRTIQHTNKQTMSGIWTVGHWCTWAAHYFHSMRFSPTYLPRCELQTVLFATKQLASAI